ncbi:MAG: cell division protein ZapA [Thermoanaerobaculia bacterium]
MSAKSTTAVEVEIFGGTYQVRGTEDAEYLRELAATVDRRMRDIAGHVATADTAKIAILAALNLADELSKSRRQEVGETDEVRERMAQLTEELTAALSTH